MQALIRCLGLDEAGIIEKYCEISGGKVKIRSGKDGFCIFFASGLGCKIHEYKPRICRAWPFFRGNLIDPISLEMAKDFCPGIEKDVSHPAFAATGLAYLREFNLLATDQASEAAALLIGSVNGITENIESIT